MSGLVSDEYGEKASAPTPSAENEVVQRWRHEGREKRSGMANEVMATEARTIIIVRRYRWPDGPCQRVWRADPRHDQFNSAWANPARVSCGAWAVALSRSTGPAWHDYFFTLQRICKAQNSYKKKSNNNKINIWRNEIVDSDISTYTWAMNVRNEFWKPRTIL